MLAPRRAQDGLNLQNDFANSILDHRHRFTLSIVYDSPFFKNGNAFLRNTLGEDGKFAPIYTYQSGQWVTAQSIFDSNLNGDSSWRSHDPQPGRSEGDWQRSDSIVQRAGGGLPRNGVGGCVEPEPVS